MSTAQHKHAEAVNIASREMTAVPIAVRRETAEAESRSVEAVLVTSDPVLVRDPRTEDVIEEALIMRGAVLPEQVPMLDSHMRSSSNDVRGSIRDLEVRGEELIGRLHFAADDMSQVAWGKVRDGHITDVSGGYTRISYRDVPAGESREIDGVNYTAGQRTLRVVTRWRLKEGSLTPIGADERAKIKRTEQLMSTPGKNKSTTDDGTRSALSTEIFRLIQENATDEKPEYAVLDAIATATGLEHGTVKDIVGGTIAMPSKDALDSFATALDVSSEALMQFASEDGLAFADSSSGGDEPSEEERSGEMKPKPDDGAEREKHKDKPASEGARAATSGGGTPSPSGDTTAMTPEEARKQAAKDERDRIDQIRSLAGDDIPDAMVTRAISEEMTVADAGLMFHQYTRNRGSDPAAATSDAPAVHTRERTAIQQELACSAALCQRAGVEPENFNFDIIQRMHPQTRANGQRDALPRGDKERADFIERAFDDAARLGRRNTLMDICERSLEIQGRPAPQTEDDIIREAVSTGALANIFTQSIDAIVGTPFQEAEDSTREWCEEVDVGNFKEQEDITFGTTQGMKKLPRGKKAEHTTIDDAVEKWRIARYAERFIVDEQDLIDDRFDKIRDMSIEMVEDAAQLRPNLVYAILLNNPELADAIELFHADHGNTMNDPLSAEALQTAIQAMGKQRRGGRPLNIRPRWLLHPQDLRFKALQILRSAERRESDTADGTANTLQNLGITSIGDDRLGAAGVVDPDTDEVVAGSATNWFLLANRRTVRVGYRRGTGRRPVVRVNPLGEGQWGLGFDINLDIGAYPRDFRGMQRSTGTG